MSQVGPRLASMLDQYAMDHKHPKNRLTHKIGVPLILFHIVAMLDWVHLGSVAGTDISLAIPVGLVILFWYFTLDLPIAAAMLLASGICLGLSAVTPWPVVVGIAVFAWVLQFIGHYHYEKRSPAFFKNLQQLLVGPLFFVALMLGRYEIRPAGPAPVAG